MYLLSSICAGLIWNGYETISLRREIIEKLE